MHRLLQFVLIAALVAAGFVTPAVAMPCCVASSATMPDMPMQAAASCHADAGCASLPLFDSQDRASCEHAVCAPVTADAWNSFEPLRPELLPFLDQPVAQVAGSVPASLSFHAWSTVSYPVSRTSVTHLPLRI